MSVYIYMCISVSLICPRNLLTIQGKNCLWKVITEFLKWVVYIYMCISVSFLCPRNLLTIQGLHSLNYIHNLFCNGCWLSKLNCTIYFHIFEQLFFVVHISTNKKICHNLIFCFVLMWLYSIIGGVMVGVLAASVVDHGIRSTIGSNQRL